jgi:hypothetical protein
VVAEVEATINPKSILRDWHILLRVNWPLSRQRNLFFEGCGVHVDTARQIVNTCREKSKRGGGG